MANLCALIEEVCGMNYALNGESRITSGIFDFDARSVFDADENTVDGNYPSMLTQVVMWVDNTLVYRLHDFSGVDRIPYEPAFHEAGIEVLTKIKAELEPLLEAKKAQERQEKELLRLAKIERERRPIQEALDKVAAWRESQQGV